ncbi:unnamed protein product, partial [Mesorhabditis spiculigera]
MEIDAKQLKPKPSHLNRFFDRLRGSKVAKSIPQDKDCDVNKENFVIGNGISKEESFQKQPLENRSPRDKSRSPFNRLKQRLSLRRKAGDRVDDVKHNPETIARMSREEPDNFSQTPLSAPRSAMSENDVRFLSLSLEPNPSNGELAYKSTYTGFCSNQSTSNHVGLQSMSLDDVSMAKENGPPARIPSYLRISVGAHGYNSKAKPTGMISLHSPHIATLSNVERLKLFHEKSIDTTSPTKNQPLDNANGKMGNAVVKPAKAGFDRLSGCWKKNKVEADESELKVKPQLVIGQPMGHEINVSCCHFDSTGALIPGSLNALLRAEEAKEVAVATQEIPPTQDRAETVHVAREEKEPAGSKGVATRSMALVTHDIDFYQKTYNERKEEMRDRLSWIEKNGAGSENTEGEELIRQVQFGISMLEKRKGKMSEFEALLAKYLKPVEGDPQIVTLNDLAGWMDLLDMEWRKIDIAYAKLVECHANNWTSPIVAQESPVPPTDSTPAAGRSTRRLTPEQLEKRREADEKRRQFIQKLRANKVLPQADTTRSEVTGTSTDQ